MKHLVFVYSHLSYLVINQYFVENNIDPKDCLFILSARYNALPEGNNYTNTIYFPDELLPNGYKRVFHKNNIIIGLKNIRHVEDKINSFFKGDIFTMYLTNTTHDCFSALATMKQCTGYYLIEEGAGSYIDHDKAPKHFNRLQYPVICILSKILPRFYVLKCSQYSINNKYYSGTIATTQKAFQNYPGKHIIINSPFSKITLDNVPDVILSIDASLMMSLGSFFPTELYKKISEFFNCQGYHKIAYKFHPKYYADPSLLKTFRKGLTSVFGKDVVELDEKCQLENCFMSYPIDFCSDFSSVGIYAANYGRKCYSYMNLVKELYPQSTYDKDYKISKYVLDLFTNIPSI